MTNTIKTVDELREALEAVKTAEQAEAALNSTTIQTLKKYVKEEDYYFGKPISKLTKAEIVTALTRHYEPEEPEESEESNEAEPTLEELEQETGFTYCRRLGQEFLSGEVSLGQLTNQIESLKRSFKYGDNSGTLHGLAYAFGITIEGKSCEELLSEIEKFIKNREFEKLAHEEKIHTQKELHAALRDAETVEDFKAIFERSELKTVRDYAVNMLSGWTFEDLKKLTRSEIAECIFSKELSPREKACREARQKYLAEIVARLRTAERDSVLAELVAEAEKEISNMGILQEVIVYLNLREKFEQYKKEAPIPEATLGDGGPLGRLAKQNREIAVRVINEALNAEQSEFESLSSIDKLNKLNRIHEIEIEERRAKKGHANLQAEINEVREKWKAVQTALRTFNPKENRHLAGLKMLAEELRQRYFDLRLESLRFYLRMKAISKAI